MQLYMIKEVIGYLLSNDWAEIPKRGIRELVEVKNNRW